MPHALRTRKTEFKLHNRSSIKYNPPMRIDAKTRKTGETDISLEINIDGSGCAAINTGHAFYDHMLHLFTRHSLMDMTLNADGDLDVDAHHTVEDVAIVLGESLRCALGDKKGIKRYGTAYVPMDETLARAVIDLSNRPFLEFRVSRDMPDAPNFPLTLCEEFCRALVNNLRCNLHIEVFYGRDGHHIAEAIFKSVAHALREAMEIDPRAQGILPSTKGTLS